MEAVMMPQRQVHTSIPQRDYHFIRTLSQKMGWTIHTKRKSGLEKAIDDVQAGHVYEAANVDDLLAQLET